MFKEMLLYIILLVAVHPDLFADEGHSLSKVMVDKDYKKVDFGDFKNIKRDSIGDEIKISGIILFFSWDFDDGYDGYLLPLSADLASIDISHGIKVVIPIDEARQLKATGASRQLNKKPVHVYGTIAIERLFESQQIVILFHHIKEVNPAGQSKHGESRRSRKMNRTGQPKPGEDQRAKEE